MLVKNALLFVFHSTIHINQLIFVSFFISHLSFLGRILISVVKFELINSIEHSSHTEKRRSVKHSIDAKLLHNWSYSFCFSIEVRCLPCPFLFDLKCLKERNSQIDCKWWQGCCHVTNITHI